MGECAAGIDVGRAVEEKAPAGRVRDAEAEAPETEAADEDEDEDADTGNPEGRVNFGFLRSQGSCSERLLSVMKPESRNGRPSGCGSTWDSS